MAEDHTITKALAEISQRRDLLQAEYERIGTELAKLQMAEGALRSIVENTPLDAVSVADGPARRNADRAASSGQPSTRGPRGPRANSAKGRLRALLESAGPQGLSTAQVAQRLPDVAPATLNAYLSTMASSGEAIRRGDFISIAKAAPSEADPESDAEDGDEDGDEDAAPADDADVEADEAPEAH
ncbi:hypothetical protein AFCDBAGC_1785 [Methylobacterium cerastii]|uniref:Uncharacterized protein n=1 Tax=Methylobacterium cerastii TaxID=932741 RepID=A0ABQ4QGQ4_9HYPH|nr:hypothetical protein AFCDBAGC_1785 [Methylobacterium cerastii]